PLSFGFCVVVSALAASAPAKAQEAPTITTVDIEAPTVGPVLYGPFRDNGDVLSAAAADTANPQDDRYGSSVEADSALPKVYTLDEIVVTGSRIRGELEIAAPLNIITREDLANTGFQTIEQVLESTPQNF